MSDAHCNNLAKRKSLGMVTHDNTGGPFVVECQGCGTVYPSFQCGGGGQIADTGDYEDAFCPHCEHEDPDECENVGLAWNTQQLKINELQERLTAADERADRLEREAREDTTIDERDRYHEMADRLALAISNHFRVEIGEHSSMNCPWTEALNVMNGEYVTDSDHERRVGVLEELLRDINDAPGGSQFKKHIEAALKPAEGGGDDS